MTRLRSFLDHLADATRGTPVPPARRLPFDGRLGTLARLTEVTYSHDDGYYRSWHTAYEKQPCPAQDAEFVLSRAAKTRGKGHHFPVLDIDHPVTTNDSAYGVRLTITVNASARARRRVHRVMTRAGLTCPINPDTSTGRGPVRLTFTAPIEVHPSTTPGHHHLYVFAALSWWQYKRVLRALAAAEVLERQWVQTSIESGYTFARLPR